MADWRLRGQEEYLKNATLYKVSFPQFWEKAYLEKNAFYQSILKYALKHVAHFPHTKDYLEVERIQHFWHEHCEFCWEKALTDKSCEFYSTQDMHYWICAECFQDFRAQFHWQVRPVDEMFGQANNA